MREHIAVIHAKSSLPSGSFTRSDASRNRSLVEDSQVEDSDEHEHDHEPIPSTSRGVPTRQRHYSSSSSDSSEDEEPRKGTSFSCPRCEKVRVNC